MLEELGMELLEIDFIYQGNIFTAIVLTDGESVRVSRVSDDCGGRYCFEDDEGMMGVIGHVSVQAWMDTQSDFYSEEVH